MIEKFTYEKVQDTIQVSSSLDLSDKYLKYYNQIKLIRGNNGNDEYLTRLTREESDKHKYSYCKCILEFDGIRLNFYPYGQCSAKPSIEDIELEYNFYRNQIIDMIKEVIRLQEMIKLIPSE
jgi:hypothetical protein